MMYKYFRSFLFIGFFLLQFFSGQAQTMAWQPKQPLGDDVPSRFMAGMTSLNDKLYITGGYNMGVSSYVHDFLEYDPATSVFRNLTPPVTSNTTTNILVTVNGKIYYLDSNKFLEYNFSANAWAPKATNSNIFASGEGSAFVIGNEIFVFSETNTNFAAYNVVTDSWTAKASYPGSARRAAMAFSLDGKGYFGGGNSYATNGCTSNTVGCFLQDFHEYNPATDSWAAKASFPKPIKSAASYGHNSKGYVGMGNVVQVSGSNFGISSSEWLEYNPVTNIWTSKSSGPYNSVAPLVAKINNDIYVFGGRGGTNNFGNQTYSFIIKYNVPGNSWTINKTVSGGNRTQASGFNINNKIYIGGGHDGQPLNDFWEYDISTNTWTVKAPLPSLHSQRPAVAVNGKGYFIGGYLKDYGKFTDSLMEYNPATNSWAIKAPFPGGKRGGIAAFVLNGKIYAGLGFNGSGSSNTDFYMYDPTTNTWTNRTTYPGNASQNISAFSIGNTGYIYQHQNGNLYAYDPVTNTWTAKAISPLNGNSAPASNQAFTLNGMGYVVISDYYNSGSASSKIYEYNPTGNSWRLAGNAPFLNYSKQSATVVGTANEGFIGFGETKLDFGYKTENDWWRLCIGTSSTITATNCESYTLNGQTYTTSGTYTQTRPNAAGCDSIITINLTIRQKPTNPGVTPTVTYCQGTTTNALTAAGTSLLWYTASTGGTGSATAPVPVTAAAGTTDYYVSQTVNGCESNRALITVTVTAAPNAPTVTSTQTYCQGTAATALSASGSGLQWYTALTGGTGTATAPTPSTTSAGTTVYYVSQTVNGCESARASISVSVNAKPANPVIAATTSLCQGSVATPLTATGSGLLWYTGATGGTGTAAAPTPSTASVGSTNYYVSQTVNGCESDRAVALVQVTALPATPTITQNGNILTSSSAAGNQWFLNGTAIPGATSQTYVTTANGNYSVVVTAGGCTSANSAGINVTNLGLSDALAGMKVEIYPNPATGSFNVKLNGYQKVAKVVLYNLAGQQLITENVAADGNAKNISLKYFSAGTYLLKVISEEGVQVSRLIVQ